MSITPKSKKKPSSPQTAGSFVFTSIFHIVALSRFLVNALKESFDPGKRAS